LHEGHGHGQNLLHVRDVDALFRKMLIDGHGVGHGCAAGTASLAHKAAHNAAVLSQGAALVRQVAGAGDGGHQLRHLGGIGVHPHQRQGAGESHARLLVGEARVIRHLIDQLIDHVSASSLVFIG
jgi:hypothetical protein